MKFVKDQFNLKGKNIIITGAAGFLRAQRLAVGLCEMGIGFAEGSRLRPRPERLRRYRAKRPAGLCVTQIRPGCVAGIRRALQEQITRAAAISPAPRRGRLGR